VLAAAGRGRELLPGQRAAGDRPGGGGAADAGWILCGDQRRPETDARGPGESGDTVVCGIPVG